MQQNFSLPQSLQNLLARIQNAGFLAYAVGGCVRDSLLGRPIHDWDVTTNAHPKEIKNIFADCRTIDQRLRYHVYLPRLYLASRMGKNVPQLRSF